MRINDATLNYTIAIADLPVGGNIGTAAATVDRASCFNINQTTAGQTITLPTPTETTAGRAVTIANVGTQSFVLITATLSPSEAATMLWNGTTWVFAGTDPSASTTRLNQILAANGVNGINNLNNAQVWNWNTLTNQNALSLFSTTITSGTLLQVGSSSANIHPGALVKISLVSATATGRALEVTSTTAGAMTNGIIYNLFTGAFTNEGIKVNATTMATGTLALYTTSAMTTGNILKLENLNAASTGASLLLSTSQTGGNVVFLNNATITNGVGLNMAANAVTTGAVARFSSTGATITTGSILNVSANSTGTATNGIVYFQNSSNSSGVLLGLENATTTGTTLRVLSNSLTSGTGALISSTSVGMTGSLLSISSSSTSNTSSGVVQLNIGSNSHSGYGMYITDNGNTSTSLYVDGNKTTGKALHARTASAHSGPLGHFESASATATGNALLVDSIATGANVAQINGTALTTGYVLGLTANANTSKILRIGNSTGSNDIYRSTASPTGVITGNRGDLCIVNTGTEGNVYIKDITSGDTSNWKQLQKNNDYAELSMFGNATDTVITAVDTPVKAAGTTTLDYSSSFSMPTNNRLTYTGPDTNEMFEVTVNAAFWVGSNDRNVSFYIYKDGVQVATSKQSTNSRQTNVPAGVSFSCLVQLSTNNYIEVYVENNENAGDIRVRDMRVIIQSL